MDSDLPCALAFPAISRLVQQSLGKCEIWPQESPIAARKPHDLRGRRQQKQQLALQSQLGAAELRSGATPQQRRQLRFRRRFYPSFRVRIPRRTRSFLTRSRCFFAPTTWTKLLHSPTTASLGWAAPCGQAMNTKSPVALMKSKPGRYLSTAWWLRMQVCRSAALKNRVMDANWAKPASANLSM